MSENTAGLPPRIDGDESKPGPACERTPETPQGQSGAKFSFIPTVDIDHNGAIAIYGHMGTPLPPPEQRVGARISAGSRCTRCGGPFLAGHVITADLAPNMAGTARHTDCGDPKLERMEVGR